MNASAFVIFKITPGSNECQPYGLCLSTSFFKAACKLLNISGMGFPQGRRQRGANGALPPISNMCPPIHFCPPVLYNPTLCSKDDPPLAFFGPLLRNHGDWPVPRSCSCQGDCGICYAYAVDCLSETLLSKKRLWKRQ